MKKIILFGCLLMVFGNSAAETKSPVEELGNLVSIGNVYDGTYLTVYSNSKGSELFGYNAWAYKDEASRQNFRVIYRKKSDDKVVIRFKYEGSNSCVRSYKDNGVDKVVDYDCDIFEGNDWEMIYASTGAVQLKNLKDNNCLESAEHAGGTIVTWYAKYRLATCRDQNVPRNQLWVVMAPRKDAD